MKYLIDTNIIIDVLKNKQKACDFLESLASTYIPSISVLTVTEIIAGVKPSALNEMLKFLNTFNKISVTEDVSIIAGELIYSYAQKSRKIHFQDALIASTAILNNLVLATANIKDFEFIEELKILKYKSI